MRLREAPAASAAQVHDWLKEYYPNFPKVSPKTIYNFVMSLSQKYCISKDIVSRGVTMHELFLY